MDSQERFENMVGLVEAHQYEWAIWQAAERQEPLLKALADCREAVFSDSGPESEHFAQAIGCPEAVPAYVKDVVEKLRKSRAEALLDAERAREERNREHVRLNAGWMAKCEELRKDALPSILTDAVFSERLWGGTFEGWCNFVSYYQYVPDPLIDALRALAKKEGA